MLEQINHQIQTYIIVVKKGCHVDASITQSPRNPKTKPCYEVINDREDHDDESDAQAAMRVIEDKPLAQRQLQRNRLITKVRYVVE